jgi:transcriptional regulator with XRE-family HTH domain
MANIDKLNSLATSDSNWLGEAKNRQKNKEWLKHSRKIAIKILRTLREKSIKQKELAAMINVSPQQINKIVKGKENLTLETISKLEKALETKLIFSKNENQTITKIYNFAKEYIYFHIYSNKEEIAKQKTTYKYRNDYFQQNVVNEKIANYG